MKISTIIFSALVLVLAACNNSNVTNDSSLKKYFDEYNVKGCFGLYDNGQGHFTIYNPVQYKDSAYLPASTFKIVNSLIGIETGRVKDDSTIIPWDGIVRNVPEWNQDLTMKQAFKYSSYPWYQELARRIGKDTMQHWLDSIGYASRYKRAVINKIDTFWLDNEIKITPDEQLGLVKKLYFDQLPFQQRTQRIVRDMMLQEDSSNYKLCYKTGTGYDEQKNTIAWITGWIEENKHPYFFVLQLQSPSQDIDTKKIRMSILKNILTEKGFMKGKM